MSKPVSTPPKSDPRFSPALREAVRLHVLEGRSVAAAAREAGMSRQGLTKALTRPAVKALADGMLYGLVEQFESKRLILRAKALEVARDLLDNAKSESVRARMAAALLGEPKGPAVAVQINNAAAQAPGGYTYIKPDWVIARDRAAQAAGDQVSGEGS